MRSGLITLDQLLAVPLVRRFHDASVADHPALGRKGGRRLLSDVLRRMLSAMVHDLIAHTRSRLHQARPQSAEEARRGQPLVAFSPAMRRD